MALESDVMRSALWAMSWSRYEGGEEVLRRGKEKIG